MNILQLGEIVTRPYESLGLEEIELRGQGTANMLLIEEDPWKARVREIQIAGLRAEWRMKRVGK